MSNQIHPNPDISNQVKSPFVSSEVKNYQLNENQMKSPNIPFGSRINDLAYNSNNPESQLLNNEVYPKIDISNHAKGPFVSSAVNNNQLNEYQINSPNIPFGSKIDDLAYNVNNPESQLLNESNETTAKIFFTKEQFTESELNINNWINIVNLDSNEFEGYQKYKIIKRKDLVEEWRENIDAAVHNNINLINNLEFLKNELTKLQSKIQTKIERARHFNQYYQKLIHEIEQIQIMDEKLYSDLESASDAGKNKWVSYNSSWKATLKLLADSRKKKYLPFFDSYLKEYQYENQSKFEDMCSDNNEELSLFEQKFNDSLQKIDIAIQLIKDSNKRLTTGSKEIKDDIKQIVIDLNDILNNTGEKYKYYVQNVFDFEYINFVSRQVSLNMIFDAKQLLHETRMEEYNKEITKTQAEKERLLTEYQACVDQYKTDFEQLADRAQHGEDESAKRRRLRNQETRRMNEEGRGWLEACCVNSFHWIGSGIDNMNKTSHNESKNIIRRISQIKEQQTKTSNRIALLPNFTHPQCFEGIIKSLEIYVDEMSVEHIMEFSKKSTSPLATSIIRRENLKQLGISELDEKDIDISKYTPNILQLQGKLKTAYNKWIEATALVRFLEKIKATAIEQWQKLENQEDMRMSYNDAKKIQFDEEIADFERVHKYFQFFQGFNLEILFITKEIFFKITKQFVNDGILSNFGEKAKSSFFNQEISIKQIEFKLKKHYKKIKKVADSKKIYYVDLLEILKSKKFWGAIKNGSKLKQIQVCSGLDKNMKEEKRRKEYFLYDFQIDEPLTKLISACIKELKSGDYHYI